MKDNVSVHKWQRDRSWVPTANMRINEFRRMDVQFDMLNPDAHHIELKMTKNLFPFGATIDKMMPNEMDDYKQWFDPELKNIHKLYK